MSTVTLAADSSTLVLNGRAITDFVDGDTILITPVNELTAHTRSNKSLNIQQRSDGRVHDVTFRLPKYSDDDRFMGSVIASDTPVVVNGSCKEDYQINGQARTTTWTLENGSVTVQPTDTKNNQDGNILMEYVIRFNRAVRL